MWQNIHGEFLGDCSDCCHSINEYFQILEYASQGDLLSYVQRVGAIPDQKRRLWSHQLCDAVKYLHQLEVVHRDLKLENLLLDHHGLSLFTRERTITVSIWSISRKYEIV